MKTKINIRKKIFFIILFVFIFMCMLNKEISGKEKIIYKPKVSIIVPVYNEKEYLHECLDSLINQTLEDIETICVDDGSKDNSEEILEDYAEKDKERMKVKIFKEKIKNKKSILREK